MWDYGVRFGAAPLAHNVDRPHWAILAILLPRGAAGSHRSGRTATDRAGSTVQIEDARNEPIGVAGCRTFRPNLPLRRYSWDVPANRRATNYAAKPRRPYRGVVANERVAERRRRFLDAGFELFGTRGFADARIRDLCLAADLTDRYFYESFKNMEELFDVVVADLAAEVHQVSLEAMNEVLGGSPTNLRAWVRAALASGMEFMAADPRRIRIAFVETVRVRGHADYRRTFTSMAEEDLLQMIPRLSGTKSLTVDEARMRAVACIAAGNELVVVWAEGRIKSDLTTIIEFVTDLWLAAMSLPDYEPPSGRSRRSRITVRSR